MRRKMVAGNWKMNGTRTSVAELICSLRVEELPADVDVVVLPSSIHLAQVLSDLQGEEIAVGAQDCSTEPGFGAFTGEESATQLRDLGCAWVLVGHSERRSLFAESDQVVCRKFSSAQASGLKPILCVGETLEERQLGKTLDVVSQQLNSVLDVVGVDAFESAVVAYEPVWAIGSGLTATPVQAQEVHAVIRAVVAQRNSRIAGGLRILYGGSVKSENAVELFAQADVDGGLIGGASLKANEFGAICRAAGK
ncbi:MAG: triose-phosphate isomerase [Pseudomonas sp.]|nr:triose-phosphate isomerase [Pseudomonas sp.]